MIPTPFNGAKPPPTTTWPTCRSHPCYRGDPSRASWRTRPSRGGRHGPSSRRGPQALLELTGWAENGFDLAITPDGPRGPRYVIQDGVMSLAQLTGLSIIPALYAMALMVVVAQI